MSKKARAYIFIIIFILLAFGGRVIEHFEKDAFVMETTTVKSDLPYKSDEEVVLDGKININSADEEQLQLLHGVGKTIARRIVEYREESGPFKSIEEIMQVPGISEKKFEELKDAICVGNE